MSASSVPYLRRGSYGEYVRVVQKVLNHYLPSGMAPLIPDAKFGPKTEAAVKSFQGRYGLVPDGIIGPLTRAKLFPLGTYNVLNFMTRPAGYAAEAKADGAAHRPSFALAGAPQGQGPMLQGKSSFPLPSLVPPLTLNWPSSTTMPLAPMLPSVPVTTDQIPGLQYPLPFPDLLTNPSFPQLPTMLPLSLTLPSFFNKVQLPIGEQRTVPKLTLFGPPPSTNPVVDTFTFGIRGVWMIPPGQFQVGWTYGLPISQPISNSKNTTHQVYAQGLSPDLLIRHGLWAHLYIIGKASVTVPKDGSSVTASISPQFKSSFDLGDKVSFSVVGGPVISATPQGGRLQVTVTPFAVTTGVTLEF